MKLRNNILVTLRRKLFDSPNPVIHKSEYLLLMDEIFPDKEMFIAFLNASNFEKQLSLGNKILLRLCYECSFAPPTRLLFNLLNMQTNDTGNADSDYVARDHIVHLVHLYIFGVYVFLYHHVFNENILSLFKNKRNLGNYELKSKTLGCDIFRDFIISWRAFVLYHDIGYPLEKYLLKKSDEKNKDVEAAAEEEETKDKKGNEEEIYIDAFNKIPKFIGKDLAMRSLSKIIGVYKLTSSKSELKFKYTQKYWNDTDEDKLIQFSDYSLIDKVYGIETINTITAIYGKKSILPVLCDGNETPLLVYISDNEIIPLSACSTKSSTIGKYKEDKEAPFKSGSFSSSRYHFMYYIDHKEDIKRNIEQIFPDIPNKDFDLTVNYLQEQTSSKYTMIVSDASFKQYCFDLYMVLYTLAGYNKVNGNNDNDDFLSGVVVDMGKKIPFRMAQEIKKLLVDNLKNINFIGDMENMNSTEDVLENYLKKIAEDYTELAYKIGIPLKEEMQYQYIIKKNFKMLRESVGEPFTTAKIKNKISIKNNTLIYDLLLAEKEKKTGSIYSILKELDVKLKKAGLISLARIFEYKPLFNINGYDHGICSAVVLLSVMDIFNQMINSAKDEKWQQILYLAIGIDTSKEKNIINFKLQNILVESCYAILIHNIYPTALEGACKRFKTKLEDAPFAYFATLMDSLQNWDRKLNLNQALKELPYTLYSQNVNIEVRNNKIRIQEGDNNMDVLKIFNARKQTLNEYLENVSDYIELGLSEF